MRYLLTLLAALSCCSLFAGDWPNWRGPQFDGISREKGLLTEWPKEGPKELWSRDLPGGYSSVSVVGPQLFTMSKDKDEEVVLCLDTANGKQLWDFRYEVDYKKHKTLDKRFYSGPRSTPTVVGDHVFALGTLGSLHCLDRKTGRKIWGVDLLAMAKVDCPAAGYCWSPLVLGDVVYVQIGGNKGTSIGALKVKDGSIVWTALDDPIGYGSPIPVNFKGGKQIVFFTGVAAVGVEPEKGKELWRHEWKTQYNMNIATPIYFDGKIFLSSDYGKGCTLLELQEKGEPKETFKNTAMRNWFATSIIHDGHAYGFSGDRLKCIDLNNKGKSDWDKKGFKLGCVSMADGHLIILGEDGDLVLAEASPKEFKEKARWKALEGTCWSIPVLADGTLYVRNEKKIKALNLKKG